MTASWESTFSGWAQPPGQTEEDRIQNAIVAIRKALDADEKLAPVTKVFVQGSYRNRVNVRQDSDVDIGVLYTGNSFYPDYPKGTTKETFGIIDGDYSYSDFKDAVGKALVRQFGAGAVHRGNKAFDIHENTYRLDSDVVPVFVHRRYKLDGNPENKQVLAPITCYMGVEQTLSKLQMHLMTPESESWFVAHGVRSSPSEIGYQIVGVYTNKPHVHLRGKTSEMHLGAIVIDTHGESTSYPDSLTAEYWTDRKTTGRMTFAHRKERVFTRYADAHAAFEATKQT